MLTELQYPNWSFDCVLSLISLPLSFFPFHIFHALVCVDSAKTRNFINFVFFFFKYLQTVEFAREKHEFRRKKNLNLLANVP